MIRIGNELYEILRAYANPNTIPRIKKEKNTLWAEWTMMDIQVLRKRHAGKMENRVSPMMIVRIPQG